MRAEGRKAHDLATLLHASCERVGVFSDPLVGGGSVPIELTKKKSMAHLKLHLNDLDPWIAAFWQVIASGDPTDLIRRIEQCQPTVALHHELRQREPKSLTDRAFHAIFFNRTSFSGILNSGALGGNKQTGRSITSRWNGKALTENVCALTEHLAGRTTVTCKHINDVELRGVLFIDPPYIGTGPILYRERMDTDAHITLAAKLKVYLHPWIATYDDDPLVRDIYRWAAVENDMHRYSISGSGRARWKKTNELLLRNPDRPHLQRSLHQLTCP